MSRNFVVSLMALAAAALCLNGAAGRLLAQAQEKTVADGVYTNAQADRGAASYDTSCSGCHRPDLSGAQGPPLKEQRFARDFAGKDLNALYMKIATTMPRGAPASLGDAVYLDIVAHILRENGFPAGSTDLAPDVLPAVKLIPGKAKPAPPVGNFSYVETVGCLTQGPGDTWLLTQASAPKSVVAPADGVMKPGQDAPAGTDTFHLLDALAYGPAAHKGQRMYVRGLLIKVPAEQRITISSFETIAPSCGP